MDEVENQKLEAAVLGAIISNGDLIHKVSDILTGEMFSTGLHEKLYTCIKSLYEESGAVSSVQLYHRFANVMGSDGKELKENYLDIVNSYNSMGVIQLIPYAKTLADLHQKRLLKKLFAQMEMQILCGEKDATDIAAQVMSEATKIISTSSKDNAIGIKKAFEEIYNAIASPEPSYKAKTGLSPVDCGMGGGMLKGRVYGFLAAAKCGKTMLATTISNNLCDLGHKHLFVCAEMGSREISGRMLGQRLELPTKDFREQKDEQLKDLVAREIVKVKANVIFEDEPGIELDRLKMIVEKHVYKNKIEGFILDYYQLVGGQEKHQSQAQHLENVANWIHRVCKKNNIWCLLLVQANDEGKVLGSRGLDRACDQKYMIERPLDEQGDPMGSKAWLKMKLSRYTALLSLGSSIYPTLEIHHNGTHFLAI